MKTIMIALGVGFAVQRLTVQFDNDFFKDLAHIYIGTLLGMALVEHKNWQWFLFCALNIIEVLAFFWINPPVH